MKKMRSVAVVTTMLHYAMTAVKVLRDASQRIIGALVIKTFTERRARVRIT